MKTTRTGNLVMTEHEYNLAMRNAFDRGVEAERNSSSAKKEELARTQAVTALLEQAGKVLSRAGYMIGKDNHDNSR